MKWELLYDISLVLFANGVVGMFIVRILCFVQWVYKEKEE